MQKKQPLLVQWNSRVYLLYGAIFNEIVYDDGERDYVILKLLLFDPDSSATSRKVVFDRASDDWNKVQGLLAVKEAAQ